MAEEFKISLGAELNTDALANIKSQLDSIQTNPIELKIDIKNAKSKIDSIKNQIQELNQTKNNNGNKNIIPVSSSDIQKIDKSFESLVSSINDIKASLGSLDKDSGMKSLLSSINEISAALSNVTAEFQNLSNIINSKNFNLNIGLGNSNNPVANSTLYGIKVRNETIPKLQEQARLLGEVVKQYDKYAKDWEEANIKLILSTSNQTAKGLDTFGLFKELGNSKELSNQMGAYQQYIKLIQEGAKLKGIDLSGVTSGFSKSADELVADVQKILTGEKQMEESMNNIKNVFGGTNNFNIEGVSTQLDSILKNLTDIKIAIQDISSGVSINGLTESFNNLSNTIQDTISNCSNLKTSFYGVSSSAGDTISKVSSSLNNINLVATDEQLEQLENMKNILDNFGFNNSSINAVMQDLENMNLTITKITTRLNSDGSVVLTVKGIDELGRVVTSVKSVSEAFGELENKITGTSPDIDNISTTISQSFKQVDYESKELRQEMSKLVELQKQISNTETNLINLKNVDGNTEQVKVLEKELKELESTYDRLSGSFTKKLSMSNISTDEVLNFIDKIEQAGWKVDELKAKLSDIATKKQIDLDFKDLKDISKQLEVLDISLAKLDKNSNINEIRELESQYKKLEKTHDELVIKLQGKLSDTQLSELNTIVENTKNKLSQLNAHISDVKNNKAKDIVSNLNNGEFTAEIDGIERSLSKLSNKNEVVVQGVQQLRDALAAIDTAKNKNDIDGLIDANDRYQEILKRVKNQLDINKTVEQNTIDAQKLEQSKIALSSKMDVWLYNNSAAAKKFGAQIDELKQKLKSCDATQLKGIQSEFEEVKRQAKLAGVATQNFGDRLKAQMSKLGTYFSASAIMIQATRVMREMYDNVVEVDTAMTELYRVTDLTATQYSNLYDKMTQSAKDYGVALSDIITSTADWAKLGFDANTAAQLSEITTMYQHITDLDNSTAVENLVTAYKGFQDQLLNLYNGDDAAAIEYVADIFNELGNNYAVSAEDVGSALTKCASALSLAGNSIQESAGMVTGISEITQDADKAGNSIKVLSLRLRGMKGKLEELGEEVDSNVESISKMQTQILNLTNGKVNIFNNDGSFKSTYEIMQGIADVYYELSDTAQADLLEIIAGKNRANDIAALIEGWGQVEAATKSAFEAEGSASRENQKYLDSIQGRLDTLTATYQALSNTVINSDFVKSTISGITTILDLTDGLIKKFGTIPTLIATVSGAMSFKNIGIFSTFDTQLDGLQNKLGIFNKSWNDFFSDIKSGQGIINALFSNLKYKDGITETDVRCITNFMNEVNDGVPIGRAWQRTMSEATTAGKKMAVQVKSGAVELNSLTSSANTSKAAMIGLQVATSLFNAALTMGISYGIQLLITGLDNLINAAERASEKADEAKQKSMEIAEASKEEAKQLDELISKYKELANSDTQDSSIRTEIKDIQSQIVDLVGKQAQNLDLVNGKLDEQLQKLYELQNINGAVDNAVTAYHDAKSSSEKAVGSYKGSWSHPAIGNYDYVGARDKEAEEILKNAGYGIYLQTGGWNSNSLYLTAVGEDAKKKAEFLQGIIDVLKSAEESYDYASSDFYNDIVKQREAYLQYIDDEYKAAQDLVDIVTIASTQDDELSQIAVNSVDSFAKYRDKLINIVKNSPDLSEAISSGDLTISDIESNVTSYLATLDKYEEYYNKWYDTIGSDTAQGIQKIKDAFAQSGTILSIDYDLDAAKSEIDAFNSWIDGLSNEDKETIYNISCNTETAQYTLQQWKDALENYEIPEESKISFSDLMADEGFNSDINEYTEKIQKLQEASDKLKNGTFESSDFKELIKIFPELANDSDNLSVAISQLAIELTGGRDALGNYSGIYKVFRNQFNKLKTDDDIRALRNFMDSVIELGRVVGNTAMSIDISAESDNMDDLFKVMKESVSATGLTSDSIEKVKSRYQDLENYDPSKLFEETTNGIRLNTDALNDLEDEYEKIIKTKFDDTLHDLENQYQSLTDEIKACNDVSRKSELYAQRDDVVNQISDVATLAAQYEGLTSAYHKWEESQSVGNDRDMYEGIIEGKEELEDEMARGWLDDDSVAFLELLTGKDLSSSTASIADQIAAYKELGKTIEGTKYKVWDFFTYDEDGNSTSTGVFNFFDTVKAKVGETAAWIDENGNYNFDFKAVGGDKVIAEALGISEELVQIILRAAEDAGFKVNLESSYTELADFKTRIDETESALKDIGQEPVDINIECNDEDLDAEIEKAESKIKEINSSIIDPYVKNAQLEDANAKLDILIKRKAELEKTAFINLDLTTLEEANNKLIELKKTHLDFNFDT